MIIEKIEKCLRSRWEVPAKQNTNAVLLASFPKSGNTWLRFVFSNVIAEKTNFPQEVNFDNIQLLAPEIRGNRNLDNAIFSNECPTFLKTHFYNTRKCKEYKSVVLFREPQKALVSYYKYMTNEQGKNYSSFERFLNSSRVGIDYWSLFHRSWLSSENTIFVSYDDLIKNQFVGITQILDLLGYQIEEPIISNSLLLSSRENMAKLESLYGDPNKKNTDFKFVSNNENRYAELFKENPELARKVKSLTPIYDALLAKKIKISEAGES
ncbi:sulfotransferase domain-containing protein [Aliiglaciecola sp. NS0011-25]|uniref:sulfotransferase domain-containing protein n=1 Tax=Aliiglaciecola sp. NS0011-25 TaxID=3127654 RepID=UPI003108CDBC